MVTGVSGFVRNPLLAPLSYLRLAVDACRGWQRWLALRECLIKRHRQHQKDAVIFFVLLKRKLTDGFQKRSLHMFMLSYFFLSI